LLAHLLPQVIELRPAHVAASGHLEPLDLRRVQREGSLDPHPEGLLTDREGLASPAALALDHDALEHLSSPAVALDDLEVHPNAVAGAELRPLLQGSLLEVVDDCAHWRERWLVSGLSGPLRGGRRGEAEKESEPAGRPAPRNASGQRSAPP